MINARPNINGNTAQEFIAAARKLHDAIAEVEEAVSLIKRDVMDGRNYQMLANPVHGRTADRAKLAQIEMARDAMRDMVADLIKASAA